MHTAYVWQVCVLYSNALWPCVKIISTSPPLPGGAVHTEQLNLIVAGTEQMGFYCPECGECVREQYQQGLCPKQQLAETELAAGRLACGWECCTGLQQPCLRQHERGRGWVVCVHFGLCIMCNLLAAFCLSSFQHIADKILKALFTVLV